MSHYDYLTHTRDDYDANRKQIITDEQLAQMGEKLLAQNQFHRSGFLILWGISAVLIILQLWAVALPMVAFAVLMSLVYPRLTRHRLHNLDTVDLQSVEGRVRLMNKDLRKPDDPLFLQLRHIEIDFNFHVPPEKMADFNEDDKYRFYFTESPNFVLSVATVNET